MYTPETLSGFWGLNLRAAPGTVAPNEALDLQNVEFTDLGAVKSRDGYANFTASALTSRAESLALHPRASGSHLLAGCGTRLEAIDASGGVVASLTGLTTGTWDFARFGTPNSEISYAGQGNQTLRSWNGTAWATVANTPQAGALAVFPASNRLVAARFNTTTGGPTGGAGTSSPSHIYFSDAGDATTWDVDNFDQLTPGDGEKIQAVIAWREFLFAFKETKFFVYHGEDQSATGTPIFRNTPIDTGVGTTNPKSVVAHETGVYFLDKRGLYRTTGGEPEYLSSAVEPIFFGDTSGFWNGSQRVMSNVGESLAIWQDKVYVSYNTNAANRMLVYHIKGGWWSFYTIEAADMLSTDLFSSEFPVLLFSSALTADRNIYSHPRDLLIGTQPIVSTDNGTAITSRWRGGFDDFGTPDVKTIRETKVLGSGSPSLATSSDFLLATGTADAVDLVSITHDLETRLVRRSHRARAFSVSLSGTNPWAVQALTRHVRDLRVPSVPAGSVIP